MNDKPDAKGWRNPLRVDNLGAQRISSSLTLGEELRRKVATGWAIGSFVIECPVPATLNAIALDPSESRAPRATARPASPARDRMQVLVI